MSPLEASTPDPTVLQEKSNNLLGGVQTESLDHGAGQNTLGGMQWSVAEEQVESPGLQTDNLKQTSDPDELGGMQWSVAQESNVLDKDSLVSTPLETKTESTTLEPVNSEMPNPQDILNHLRKITTDIENADISELLALHKYLSEDEYVGLAEELSKLDPQVFEYMQKLSQEIENRDSRTEELSRAAGEVVRPKMAEALSQATGVSIDGSTAIAKQLVQGELSEIQTPEGSKYTTTDIFFMAACFAISAMKGGRELDFFAEEMGKVVLIKLGVNPDILNSLSRENNMGLRYLDALSDQQLNEWFGKTLNGREIFSLLEIMSPEQRKSMVDGRRFKPHVVTHEALQAKTIALMWEAMTKASVKAADLAKLGLSYPTANI